MANSSNNKYLKKQRFFSPIEMSDPRFTFSSKNSAKHDPAESNTGDKIRKEHRERKIHLYSIGSSEKISHDKMSWTMGESDDHREENPSILKDSSAVNSDTFGSWEFLDFNDTKSFDVDEEKRQRIIHSKWGGYGLHLRLWDEKNAPVTKIRERSELLLDNSEYCGILSDRMIGACSSFLTQSPENRRYVLSKCDLNNMNLKDISILRYHRYLQYLDLSHNLINDLRTLSEVPYLIFLNASYNKIKDLLIFKAPWYLTYVNLSHNDIDVMTDLTEFWSIVRLDLSHNSIETINGLQNLRYLKYLNLSYNLIETVSNLDDLLSIQELNLEYNCITSFVSANPKSGINTLPNLRTLIMGHNRLSSLEFFRGAYGLRLIDLRFNKIIDLLEVSNLKSLVYEVDLRGNQCTKWPNYKDVLLFSMPSVKYIDGAEVSVSEKVSAASLFDPPVELLAARTISKLLLLEQLNAARIDAGVVPYDVVSSPLVILSGPSAVKKVALGVRIAEKLAHWVRYCRSYTTREIPTDEDESKAYYSVTREEFNEMARQGEFLSIQELLGNSYGFHRSEIAAMRNENKIGITQMDLNATIQMTNNYENVKAILVVTKSENLHRQWISDKFHVFTWIKDSVENLLAMKVGRNNVTEIPETSDSQIEFIAGLVDQVINNLDLPAYSIDVRTQNAGATSTHIMQQSKTYLPKREKTRSQLEMEEKKRHITFKTDSKLKTDSMDDIEEKSSPKSSDLKVILDEYSNVIVEDEESKRKRKKARVLYRQSLLKLRSEGTYVENDDNDEHFVESVSSAQSIEAFPERRVVDPEILKNAYIKIILKSRKMYIEQHLKKPGFYCHVIFTDDFEMAYNRFVNVIHELHVNYSNKKSHTIPEIDYIRRFFVPQKVQEIVKELRENLSTSKMQRKTLLRNDGVTSWKDLMPSQMSHNPNVTGTNGEKKNKEMKKRSIFDNL